LQNLFVLYLPLADRWAILDNARGALQPIAHGTAGRTHVKEAEQWQKLKRLVQ
jgi:predicted ABC-type ATPase